MFPTHEEQAMRPIRPKLFVAALAAWIAFITAWIYVNE